MGALLDSFASFLDALPVRDAAGLGDARRAALDAALHDGVPGTRSERWKYTPLRALERRAFAASEATAISNGERLNAIPSPRIVFVNGRFDATHTDLAGLAEGVSLLPLSHVLADG